MGYQEIILKQPTDYTEDELKKTIGSTLGITNFSWQIDGKSLDARKKSNIHWQLRIGVSSDELEGGEPFSYPKLEIPWKDRKKTAVVVGSGPAGFFSALVLQKAGFTTILIERGSKVKERSSTIKKFESTGNFDSKNNYSFGEGGAGTFSDGKLTSRTKKIASEKQFILSQYIQAGAPKEIEHLAHPHLGSDNLMHMAVKMRKQFEEQGGEIRFETMFEDLILHKKRIVGVKTSNGDIVSDILVIGAGHSAHETYRMLMKNGVQFTNKNFAIGCRVEHPQELINKAQWGKVSLPGVKAAEYRLTAKIEDGLPVYTFCMCPGGTVVPAAAYPDNNIVNGMSRYRRNGNFANAACVAGINLEKLTGKTMTPLQTLDWLSALEKSFYTATSGYQAPFTTISGFMNKKTPSQPITSSYPLGLSPAPLWEMLPPQVSSSISKALTTFSRKIKGFDTGIIMGLESKTSSPLQAIRDENRQCQGFENLYMVGEGAGWSGGIISSGVDGIRTAMSIINQHT